MYSTYFVNNKTYGADDINTVLARLTTQGVSLFKDTGNALIDVETAISSFVDAGVEMYDMENCKVVALSNGKFKISKGCCWMPSGACIIFDDAGYEFTPNFKTASGSSSSTCFVYLRQGGDASGEASNDINVIVSPTRYTDGDVPLASISGSRVITDLRVFAQAKVATPSQNIIQEGSVYVSESTGDVTITPSYRGFSYIVMTNHTNENNSSGGRPKLLSGTNVYIGGSSYCSVWARKIGNQVTFTASFNGADEFTVEYMLF